MNHTNTGTKGAIGELRVCTDLLARGYEVFRAVSPSASCDLIAVRDGRIWRVEVRSAPCYGGKVYKSRPKKDAGKQDVYAWVTDTAIIYEPHFTLIGSR